MTRAAMTMMAATAAVLGAALPMPEGKAAKDGGPLTASDIRDIEAAKAKRARKAAKRAAQSSSDPGGEK